MPHDYAEKGLEYARLAETNGWILFSALGAEFLVNLVPLIAAHLYKLDFSHQPEIYSAEARIVGLFLVCAPVLIGLIATGRSHLLYKKAKQCLVLDKSGYCPN